MCLKYIQVPKRTLNINGLFVNQLAELSRKHTTVVLGNF